MTATEIKKIFLYEHSQGWLQAVGANKALLFYCAVATLALITVLIISRLLFGKKGSFGTSFKVLLLAGITYLGWQGGQIFIAKLLEVAKNSSVPGLNTLAASGNAFTYCKIALVILLALFFLHSILEYYDASTIKSVIFIILFSIGNLAVQGGWRYLFYNNLLDEDAQKKVQELELNSVILDGIMLNNQNISNFKLNLAGHNSNDADQPNPLKPQNIPDELQHLFDENGKINPAKMKQFLQEVNRNPNKYEEGFLNGPIMKQGMQALKQHYGEILNAYKSQCKTINSSCRKKHKSVFELKPEQQGELGKVERVKKPTQRPKHKPKHQSTFELNSSSFE